MCSLDERVIIRRSMGGERIVMIIIVLVVVVIVFEGGRNQTLDGLFRLGWRRVVVIVVVVTACGVIDTFYPRGELRSIARYGTGIGEHHDGCGK